MSSKRTKTNNLMLTVAMACLVVALNSSTAYSKEAAGSGSNMSNATSNWNGALHSDDSADQANCASTTSPYLASFSSNPCSYSTFYDGNVPIGGDILTKAFESWWAGTDSAGSGGAVGHLKKFAGQISAMLIAQSQMIATKYDGVEFTKFARLKQTLETNTRDRYTPNEYSCVAASNISGIAKSYAVSTALAESYKRELEKRAYAYSTAGDVNAISDSKNRWENYCTYFNDPDTNNGINSCANSTQEGIIKNGDISVETLLLKDTIDLTKEENRKAVDALLINLLNNKSENPLNKQMPDSPEGREAILKNQNIFAIRNLAAQVVSSIVARRAPVHYTSLSGTTSGALLQEIRKNAGIPDAEIATENPSYNEVMLAMTKERFFDPTYYIKVQDSTAAMQKEQTILESYINMQMNDIYQIKEQINALIAAKDSLKFAGSGSAMSSDDIKSLSTQSGSQQP